MAISSVGQMIKDFLARFGSAKEHPEVLEALGTSGRLGELFWAALATVSEDGVTVVGLPRLAATKLKMPSSYLTAVKHQGLLESGNKRGVWIISQTALKKIAKLLNGEAVSQEEKNAVVATAGAKPKNKKAALKKALIKRSKKTESPIDPKVLKMVKGLEEKLAQYDVDIARLETAILAKREEKNALLRAIALLVKDAHNI